MLTTLAVVAPGWCGPSPGWPPARPDPLRSCPRAARSHDPRRSPVGRRGCGSTLAPCREFRRTTDTTTIVDRMNRASTIHQISMVRLPCEPPGHRPPQLTPWTVGGCTPESWTSAVAYALRPHDRHRCLARCSGHVQRNQKLIAHSADVSIVVQRRSPQDEAIPAAQPTSRTSQGTRSDVLGSLCTSPRSPCWLRDHPHQNGPEASPHWWRCFVR